MRGDAGIQWVAFTLNGEAYALAVSEVQEILRVPPLTAVPGAPAHVGGLINLRGRVVPVVCLSRRLGREFHGSTRQSRVIVTACGDLVVGFLVEAVLEVVRLEPDDIEPPTTLLAAAADGCVRGVGKTPDRLVVLLDFARLIATSELEVPAAHV